MRLLSSLGEGRIAADAAIPALRSLGEAWACPAQIRPVN